MAFFWYLHSWFHNLPSQTLAGPTNIQTPTDACARFSALSSSLKVVGWVVVVYLEWRAGAELDNIELKDCVKFLDVTYVIWMSLMSSGKFQMFNGFNFWNLREASVSSLEMAQSNNLVEKYFNSYQDEKS